MGLERKLSSLGMLTLSVPPFPPPLLPLLPLPCALQARPPSLAPFLHFLVSTQTC